MRTLDFILLALVAVSFAFTWRAWVNTSELKDRDNDLRYRLRRELPGFNG
jgi:hypothetical protein